MGKQSLAKLAFRFVLIIGIVNFLADMTYEGARGIVGPFLGSLGASAAIIGFVAGFGELVGYGLRSVSGYLAECQDREETHRLGGVRRSRFLARRIRDRADHDVSTGCCRASATSR